MAENGLSPYEAQALRQTPDAIIVTTRSGAILRFRDLLESAPAPLIPGTAFSLPGGRDKTPQAGFEGYFSNPITPQTLVAEIDAFLAPRLCVH
jgi:CheY-like chemotaxis protein